MNTSNSFKTKQGVQLKAMEWLAQAKARHGLMSLHSLIILALLAAFIYFTLVVFPTFYDVYIIFLFVPLIYAAVVFRLRGAIVGSIVFVAVLVPHSLPLSLDVYTVIRSLVFLTFPFLISGMIATTLNSVESQLAAYREIIALNKKLNLSLENLEKTQKQLMQVEKMNALGQLSAAIAHEINNPLTGVIVYTQLLTKMLNNDSLNKEGALDILNKMESALVSSGKLVRSLLEFARQSTPTLRPITINSVIDQVLALVGHQAQLQKISIVRNEASGLPPVKADFSQLEQVFINLIVNAIQAMPKGGKLTINTALANVDMISVAIQDTGYGIPPENIIKLFTPFFSTKEAVKGVGLGLAISYGIVERHGGRIEVKSEVNKGSTFTVYLPVYVDETMTQPLF
jgi:signal transduction histidine kinase